MDDRRFYSSPSLCRGGRESSSNTTTETSSPLSLFRSRQQPELELQEEQDQQQNHVHQRLLSLLATRNRQQQPLPLPQLRPQQQPQQPLSAEDLLKNILHRRRAGGETTTTTLNSLTMERTRAVVAASAADPHIPLPSKLFSILGNKNFEHIVSWLPQGRAWRIHNVDWFAQRILPMFVNNNNNNNHIGQQQQQQPPLFSVNKNLRVFTQQLESWGFCELSRGPNSLAYYSELFVREAPEVRKLMRPTASTTQQSNRSSPRCVHHQQQQQHPTLVDHAAAAAIGRGCNTHQLLPSAADTMAALKTLKASQASNLALLASAAAVSSASTNKVQAAPVMQILGNHPRNNNVVNINNNVNNNRLVSPPTPLMNRQPGGPLGVVPFDEESLPQLECQMSEALRVAKELHDRSIMYLRQAKRIADSSSSSDCCSRSVNRMSPAYATNMTPNHRTNTTKTIATNFGGGHRVVPTMGLVTASPTETTTTSSSSSSTVALLPNKSTPRGKASSTMVGSTLAGIQMPTKKKNRKKWLPPLGPPTPSSSCLLPLRSSTSRSLSLSAASSNNSNSINRRCSNMTPASGNSGGTNTTTSTNDNDAYDWYYTNPEVFATLSHNKSGT